MSTLLEQTVDIEVPTRGLKVGVVSDTHSAPHPLALKHLKAWAPNVLLHGGDVGDLAVLRQLESIAPLYAVRGNIDGQSAPLPDVLEIRFVRQNETALRALLLHIALAGPKLRPDAVRRAKKAKAQLVVCGHSHVPFIGTSHGLTVFNPGSIGPKRFALPILYGLLEIGPKAVTLSHRSAETGEAWVPP
jgi:uncharacterized protein